MRLVVQLKSIQDMKVLFSEHVKMRAAMQEKESAQSGTAEREELENVKSDMVELQNDYFELQREYEKLSNRPMNSLGWSKT
ncbi:hypothetical protein Lalb_Chr12g0203841 [Lupinus albus]|uniref:Uncharacterized protein n=1 Tax=Lupinus albus TaxID=3870 RepID=A0A6A4PMM3_LUPAL|nr:hypothetical protein Lalb_Chr12g0203841 [Lupinus albus]